MLKPAHHKATAMLIKMQPIVPISCVTILPFSRTRSRFMPIDLSSIKRIYGFDFETFLITDDELAPQPVCWSFCNHNQKHKGVDQAKYADKLVEWVEDPETLLLAQNLPFDAMVLCKHYGIPVSTIQREIDEGRMRDTKVREALIAIANGGMSRGRDPRNGKPIKNFSLADLVQTYLKEDISAEKTDPDAWRLRYSELADKSIPEYPKKAYDYALQDSIYAVQVFGKQNHSPIALDDTRWTLRDEIAQTRAAWDLHCMACRGPLRDTDEIKTFGEFHNRNLEEGSELLRKTHINDQAVIYWNPKKKGTIKDGTVESGWSVRTKLLQGMVEHDFNAQGVPVPRNEVTDKAWEKYEAAVLEDPELPEPEGSIKYGQDILMACTTESLVRYGECKNSEKMISTYLPQLLKGTGRLTSSPNVLVSTGRISWRHPNLTNPPKKGGFRECFIPEEGNVFASIDYSAIELVALAQVLYERHGVSAMRDAINNNIDLHMFFGSKIIGKGYKECLAIRKDKSHKDFQLVTTARQLAKIFNFGCGGGQGALTFFLQMDADTKEAMQLIDPGTPILEIIKGLIKLWKHTWEMWPYFKWVSDQCQDGAKFTYEHPVSGRIRGYVGYTDGCNLQFQGRSADGAKNAMRLVMDHLFGDAIDSGVHCWAFVHDELLLEGPEETATEWTSKISELMVEGMQPYVPDVQVEAEPATMRRWLKEAEPHYVDQHIIPWDRWLIKQDTLVEESVSRECIVKPYYADESIAEIKGPEAELELIEVWE